MLIKAKALTDFALHGIDGDIGKVKEFYFDDRHWAVRYLVANTGNWLAGRKVLISPYSLGLVNVEKRQIAVNLTKKQIEGSPGISSDKPVSRQFEESYYNYYGWPAYWNGPYTWGISPFIAPVRDKVRGANPGGKEWNADLRSTSAVSGYNIHASDGEIGHVEDFVIDDETWAIRYLVVDTRNWWPGERVLLAPKWIERVSWDHSKVFISLSREAIRRSPKYSAEAMISRQYEAELHGHYDRVGYWIDESAAKEKAR
jgi:sporulation protein YlmC with PRC-barrel domain